MIQAGRQRPSRPRRRELAHKAEGTARILTWAPPGVLGGFAAGLWRSFWARQAELSGGGFVPRSLFCWLEGERRQEDHCSEPVAGAGAAPSPLCTGHRSARESWSILEGWAAGEGITTAPLPADLYRRDSRTMSLPSRLAKRLTLWS